MTARSDDPDVSPGTAAAAAAAGGEIWGTWEELLLACAVRRHGTTSWDSVAMEVQSRSPSAAGLTPTSCRLRFRLLHRRFAAAAEESGGDEDLDAAVADVWVEELRKLRVAELRREVERYDLSIGSLQSKVKRLKEERERSISGEAKPPVVKEEETEEEAAGKGSPEDDAGGGEDRVSGGESGRSCKESNSSDLKPPGHDASTSAAADYDGEAEVKEGAAAGESVGVKQESSGESAAGSKEPAADDEEKESSDVQSSASPSRRREREGGGGDEAEAEEASPSAPAPLPAAEAESLLAFLESVRTSKPGSVFARRLESQDGENYRDTIRRHVDLEMIRSKLEPSGACYSSASEFYRDLLLLCANALVFFPRGSPEHVAAGQTRDLVATHMSASLRRDAAAAGPSKKPKTDADVAGPLLEKAKPIIVCRKRSSIAKAAATAAAKEDKSEKGDSEEEKENEDKGKAATKDKVRGLRTNKSRGPVKSVGPNQKKGKGTEGSAAAEGTKKSEKKSGGGAAGGVVKKRNAVDFLNRMKQNSAPSTERVSLLETLKLSAATEQKKSVKAEGRKEPGSGSGSKRGRGTPPGRRNIGRPPKRAAAPPTPPPSKRAKGDTSRKRGGKR